MNFVVDRKFCLLFSCCCKFFTTFICICGFCFVSNLTIVFFWCYFCLYFFRMFTTAAYKCCFCCISLLFVSCPFPSIFLGNFVIMTKCRYICRLAVFICFTIKFYTCFISNFSWFCTTCTFWLFFYFSLNSLHMIFISIICTCKGCCRTLVIICPIPHRITIFMAQFIKFYFFLACKSTDCCTSICILHFYSCNPDLYSVLFTSCCFAL